MIIQIIQSDNQKRKIGIIKNKAFIKYVKESKHLYRKLDAWGVDAKTYTDVLKYQVKKIIVIDKEHNNKTYKADIDTFEKFGQYLHFKPHRAQIFLSRRYWNLYEKSNKQQKLF